jgi:capsular polysaccharide biosynthesis protein
MTKARIRPGLRAVGRAATLPVLGMLIGLVAAGGVTSVLPRSYEASASVIIMPGQSTDNAGSKSTDLAMAQGLAPSVARLAESREVALQTATALRLPDSEVAGHISGVFEPGIQIVTVRASAATSGQASAMANAATEAIRALCVRLRLGGESAISVATLDPASEPTEPMSPKPTLNFALGGLVGLLIGLAFTSLRTKVDDRFRRVDDAEAELGLPALGVLRLTPSGTVHRGPRLPSRGEVDVAIDGILAALTVLDPERGPRRIVVTSVGDPDSAAAVATLLAVGLRRPSSLRRYLKGMTQHTVEDVLVARRAMAEPLAVVPTGAVANYLDVAGRGFVESGFDDRMGIVLDSLAANGDHVVISAAPVLAGADLAALSRHADVVLLVVATDQARKAEAGRAALLVARLGVPLAGLVVVGSAANADGWQRASWPTPIVPFARADAAGGADRQLLRPHRN